MSDAGADAVPTVDVHNDDVLAVSLLDAGVEASDVHAELALLVDEMDWMRSSHAEELAAAEARSAAALQVCLAGLHHVSMSCHLLPYE